jgi:hypothetical protein
MIKEDRPRRMIGIDSPGPARPPEKDAADLLPVMVQVHYPIPSSATRAAEAMGVHTEHEFKKASKNLMKWFDDSIMEMMLKLSVGVGTSKSRGGENGSEQGQGASDDEAEEIPEPTEENY